MGGSTLPATASASVVHRLPIERARRDGEVGAIKSCANPTNGGRPVCR